MNDDAQLKLEIADEITEAENVHEKSGEIISAARDECKRAEASIIDIEKQTANVAGYIWIRSQQNADSQEEARLD